MYRGRVNLEFVRIFLVVRSGFFFFTLIFCAYGEFLRVIFIQPVKTCRGWWKVED